MMKRERRRTPPTVTRERPRGVVAAGTMTPNEVNGVAPCKGREREAAVTTAPSKINFKGYWSEQANLDLRHLQEREAGASRLAVSTNH